MEVARTCKSQAPTPTGGKSSDTTTRPNHSSMLTKKIRSLKLKEAKMTKEAKLLLVTNSRTLLIRDGRLSILMKHPRFNLRVLAPTSDGISTDHSTLSQECSSTE
jgi:hypothetical protein